MLVYFLINSQTIKFLDSVRQKLLRDTQKGDNWVNLNKLLN